MSKYKFQVENGYIAEGNKGLQILNWIGETEDDSPAMLGLIAAHGGELVEDAVKEEAADEPKPKAAKKKAGK